MKKKEGKEEKEIALSPTSEEYGDGKPKVLVLSDTNRETKLPTGINKVTVEMSWTVKSRSFSGEVDLDASCLLFNKYGRYSETIFWDNLSTRGVSHKGDELLSGDEEGSENVDDEKEANEVVENSQTERIEVDFNELPSEISHMVFVLNIFNNKTFANLTKIDFKVLFGNEKNSNARYAVPSEKLKKIRDNNTLIVAKIYRKKDEQWWVRILAHPQSIAMGQVVDVLIPCILREREDKKPHSPKMVEPLVATWEKISIEILEGRCLSSKDIDGRSDPYVKLECGVWKQKTKVRKETLNPIWNDAKYELKYDENLEKEIIFTVKDRDRFGKNEFIGQFRVNIAKIPPNMEMNRWFRLQPVDSEETPKDNNNNNKLKGFASNKKKTEKLRGSLNVKLLKQANNF